MKPRRRMRKPRRPHKDKQHAKKITEERKAARRRKRR